MPLARTVFHSTERTFVLCRYRLGVDLLNVSFGSVRLVILAGIADIYQFLTSPWHTLIEQMSQWTSACFTGHTNNLRAGRFWHQSAVVFRRADAFADAIGVFWPREVVSAHFK